MTDKVEEANKLVKKAKKYLAPSILDLRLKPDWEAAAPLLDKAALMYKQSGQVDKALETYELAASAQDKIGSPWHAGKHMEAAAELCKFHKMFDRVAEFYKNAAEYYITAGKATVAADALARGAKAVEESDVESALTMLYDAIDIYENETKESNAADVFRQLIQTCVKAQKYHDCVEALMRFGTMCERTGAKTSQCRCYLGAVVTYLYAGEAKPAWHLFQDALAIDAFVSCEEAFAADALFNAYRSGDAELIARVVKTKGVFKELDNSVARLAMKLPQGNLDKMARRLDRAMARSEAHEEDGGEEEGGGDGEEDGAEGDEVL